VTTPIRPAARREMLGPAGIHPREVPPMSASVAEPFGLAGDKED
jgi:hypothetical protein